MSIFKEQLLGGVARPAAQPAKLVDNSALGKIGVGSNLPKLAICLPSFSEVKADHADAALGMGLYIVGKCAMAVLREKSSMVSAARNNLAQRALDMGAEWIFFCDSDMWAPHDSIERLMRHNKDICGATYNKRVPPYETLGKLKGPIVSEEELAKGGIREAEYLPGGFILFKAAVFKKIPWPWFYETFWTAGDPVAGFVEDLRCNRMTGVPDAIAERLLADEEIRKWIEEDSKAIPPNRAMSEDYSMCRKARRYGFDIWCDLDLTWTLKHIGEQQVTCAKPGQKPTMPVAAPPAPSESPAKTPSIVLV